MSMSSLSGHAVTNVNSPDAFKVCDICGQWWNASRMNWQHQWAGNSTINLRLLACPVCLDIPQEQLRSIVLPPDPVPIKDPRIEPFQYDANPSQQFNYDQANATWDSTSATWDNVNQYNNEVPTS